jgi:hypothetical protein
MITACPYTTNRRVLERIFIFQNSGVELQRGRKMFGEIGPVVAAGSIRGWNNLGTDDKED